jgi:hypothetical protein
VALALIALAFSLTGRHLLLPLKGVGGT